MFDFEAELGKLLSQEAGSLPQHEFAELAAAGKELLADLARQQTDVSLQIEEIYDLVKEQAALREAADSEKDRANRLVLAAIGLCDLLEDFCAYTRRSGSEELVSQARLLRENSGGILAGCGILRFGEEGQPLDPQIHPVKARAESPLPREQVVEVLQSGYLYQDVLVRKAAVVVSRGPEEEARETRMADAGTGGYGGADWDSGDQYPGKIGNDDDDDEIEDYGDTNIADRDGYEDQDEGEQNE
ncbi:MAG: nucleotide exchange factor GrpE [Spirochaetia bacterium]|jgi:molecular chaperone GrpE|nr:nucleotide exchange factor GrpE [Spirochaetia bacterium]